MNIIRVSVVVPTYQRPDLLNRCLAALLTQDFDPQGYEIVVADDGVSEETRALVLRRAISLPQAHLRYVAVTGTHGPAAARNTGWRHARGAIIAFTDDDCVPQPNWLSAGVAALTRDVAAVCGRIVVPLPIQPTDYERDVSGLERAEFATANCFCRRQALRAVGGFDERFTMPWREDSDLHFTFLERGYRMASAPDAVVVHPARYGNWNVGLRQHRKIMFNALLYKKHPMLYRERVQPAPPWQYYGIVAALLFALIAAASLHGLLALAGLALWALMTAHFFARRLRHTSRHPRHVLELIVTSALIPPVAVFWRLVGAVKFRVAFA